MQPGLCRKNFGGIKTLFDVSGFVFVLAIDENHLKNSVKCLFGTENFEGYKRKFINNTFLLPHPDKKAFAEFLYDRSGVDTVIKKIQEEKRELVFLIDIYNVFRCSFSYSGYGDRTKEIDAKNIMPFKRQKISLNVILPPIAFGLIFH